MPDKLYINGSPYIGVFGTSTEDVVVLPTNIQEHVFKEICKALDVQGVKTLIGGSSVLGALICGNSSGFIVPQYALDDEIAKLEKHVQVSRLQGKMTAVGNLVLSNDSTAMVHPDMSKKAIRAIKDTLNVEAYKGTIGGLKTPGAAGVATNKGVLVHPNATSAELKFLEDIFNLPVNVSTINYGHKLIGSALLVNSKGYVAGGDTTGYELGRIEEALGFI